MFSKKHQTCVWRENFNLWEVYEIIFLLKEEFPPISTMSYSWWSAEHCIREVEMEMEMEGGHIGPKSLILAPQEILDISGYQWGFGRQFVKAYNNENGVTYQKIL